jgi:hypothetical protein
LGAEVQKTRKINEGEHAMKSGSRWFVAMAAVLFSMTALISLYALAAGQHTFTGEVGDAMCGRKHMEGETAAECTRACVAHGSKFALVVGDKIYTLDTTDKGALATLDKLAGKTATVTGSLDGDTIQVSSVVAK